LIRSFQMKLTLLSTLVSGVVLTVFGLVFWHLVTDFHQQRLDRDMARLTHQLLAKGDLSLENLHLGAGQVAVFGEELEGVATLLTDAHQQVVHQSDNWPDDMAGTMLPPATRLEQTNLSRHGHDGHSSGHDATDDRGHLTQNHGSGGNLIEPHFTTVEHKGHQWRLIGLQSTGHTLHVALDLATFNANLKHVRGAMILAIGGAMFVSALGAWWVSRRALRPVRALTEMAEGVTASELRQRIEDRGADLEFARLIHVFNQMLERLEASFQQAVRFSADASHELKTPLTVMRGEVETALQRAPVGSEVQLTLASQLEEVQRLNNLVEKLLLLSHADSGALCPSRVCFDFSDLVRRVCEDIPALDPHLTVECRVDITVDIIGDQDLLRQVVQNLIVNAVHYNLPRGWVRCELEKVGNNAVLRVSNSAEPITADQRDKIFRRFYRVDEARSRGHTGLGLSLAREIARVHGGMLELAASDQMGTCFELRLPLRPA